MTHASKKQPAWTIQHSVDCSHHNLGNNTFEKHTQITMKIIWMKLSRILVPT